MSQVVFQQTFPNGLTLLAERMEHVRSAAINILIPAGCVYDPPERLGLASILSDIVTRGAGRRDSRELTLALDSLGLDRSESVGQMHMRFYAATLARNLPDAIELYADILRRPHLPDDELEAVKSLAEQDIQGLEDEPRQKVLIELRKRHYPRPLSNDRRGSLESVTAVAIEDLRGFYAARFRPTGTIVSVAGNIDWEPLRDQIGRLFGDWQGSAAELRVPEPSMSGTGHIPKETQQTQIALAYRSAPFASSDYYTAMGAVSVLSGGMSSRLFTEIREKEGLCYAVWATYQTFRDRASIIAYAGTKTDRAQETLDRLVHELRRLREGIGEDEVDRAKAGLKSSLIMQEESTSARAGSLASDWYYLNRVRGLDEVKSAIDGLSPGTILDYVQRYPAQDLCTVTLGAKPLDFSKV
ncbi:MAG: pitrilysin family protein [Gemmataceae bacterium]